LDNFEDLAISACSSFLAMVVATNRHVFFFFIFKISINPLLTSQTKLEQWTTQKNIQDE
jgi:hypothetical protein